MSTPTGTLKSIIGDQASYSLTDALGFPVTQPVNLTSKYPMAYGATANDANDTTSAIAWYYENTHTISIASSTFDMDLTLLTDIFGFKLANGKIYKIIIVGNDVSGGSGFTIGGAASNAWTGPFNGSATAKQSIGPRGRFINENPDGFNVTSGSKVLRIANDAASPSGAASFNIHLWGS